MLNFILVLVYDLGFSFVVRDTLLLTVEIRCLNPAFHSMKKLTKAQKAPENIFPSLHKPKPIAGACQWQGGIIFLLAANVWC